MHILTLCQYTYNWWHKDLSLISSQEKEKKRKEKKRKERYFDMGNLLMPSLKLKKKKKSNQIKSINQIN